VPVPSSKFSSSTYLICRRWSSFLGAGSVQIWCDFSAHRTPATACAALIGFSESGSIGKVLAFIFVPPDFLLVLDLVSCRCLILVFHCAPGQPPEVLHADNRWCCLLVVLLRLPHRLTASSDFHTSWFLRSARLVHLACTIHLFCREPMRSTNFAVCTALILVQCFSPACEQSSLTSPHLVPWKPLQPSSICSIFVLGFGHPAVLVLCGKICCSSPST
jgi:hypothetical protein